ncbi:hypothetical protein [Spiroplasma endosymbiont of Othius punctulatus]|uniref:hypothetical protein n=1 Tax=Spiroplasma endosymbiont of Othius punctulatus TaxID=3066289 RepID=UPI0030CBAE52
MKNNFISIFSPSKNWKTSLYLVVVVFVLSFALSIFMGFQYNNAEGKSETFWLIAKYENSLAYISHIFDSKNTSTFAPTTINQSAQLFSTISDWLLISFLIWFVIVIGFTVNHFRFIGFIGKKRRLINASIILVASLILLILIFLYWVAYFQAIPVLINKEWHGSTTWYPSWQTTFQLTIMLVGVTLIVAMAAYNVFVEQTTVYVSISKKNEIESSKSTPKPVVDSITSDESDDEITTNILNS